MNNPIKAVGVVVIGGVTAKMLHAGLDGVAPPQLPHWVLEILATAVPILITWLMQSPIKKEK
jgi:hypothetical protein